MLISNECQRKSEAELFVDEKLSTGMKFNSSFHDFQFLLSILKFHYHQA